MKELRAELGDDLFALGSIVKRCLKMFLKDGMAVFFSLLAPLIVFLLYVLFLADIQVDAVNSAFPEGFEVSKGLVKAFVDNWMVSGVLGVACITVSLSANSIMVQDKQRGQIRDCLASPVKRSVITTAYFVFNFVVTAVICTIVYLVCLVYLAASGSFTMTASDVFAVFGVLLFSVLSATLITVFLASLFRTEATLSGFIGIISAAIGFLTGAFMPLSIFPTGVQYVSSILPGTHSSGMFRHFLMSEALEDLVATVPEAAQASLRSGLEDAFSMQLNFFGKMADIDVMAIYIAVIIIVFVVINLTVGTKLLELSDRKSLFGKNKKTADKDDK